MSKGKFLTYAERISQTKEQGDARQNAIYVEQSKFNIDSASQQLAGKTLASKGELIKAKSHVVDAEIKADAAMATKPLNVQGMINAKADLQAALENVERCEKVVSDNEALTEWLTTRRGQLGL